MAITTSYTLVEARNMLALYKEAEQELVSGQVKSYKIGSRELTLLDLNDIIKQIERFSNIIDALTGQARTSRVTRVVPRDL